MISVATNRSSLLSNTSGMSSSAASYRTAPIYTHSPTSSVHTITITTKEKVPKDDKLVVSEGLFDGGAVQRVGPPPPSPPASVDQQVVEEEREGGQEKPEPQLPSRLSTSSHQTLRPTMTASPYSESSVPAENLLAPPVASTSSQPAPPSAFQARPARRNTTGSTPSSPKHRRFNPQGMAAGGSQTFACDDGVLVGAEGAGVELATDIELAADQIRRERMSKRFKQQQQEAAGMGLSRSGSKGSQDDQPLVGNLIGEDHVNYVLMYNMLTGIRVGVSNRHSVIVLLNTVPCTGFSMSS
jgi:1-phosphatidylinositol-4-phosphate 5-kinase